jgi:hypothetical protein
MNPELTTPRLIAGAIAIVLIILVAVTLYLRKRRKTTEGLRARFGPEYDQAVLTHGSERKAEAKLADRETRVEGLKIRELGATERERFIADWRGVQSRFVDHPKGAVTEADELVSALLKARGYPVADFDQRAADISAPGGILPLGPRRRVARRQGRGKHGRPAKRDDPVPLALR